MLENNGIKTQALKKKYASDELKLHSYDIKDEGKVSDVCVGTGKSDDINYYLNRPKVTGDLHGQAPILWFAYSLLN